MRFASRTWLPFVGGMGFLLSWHVAVLVWDISPLILPAPIAVAQVLWTDALRIVGHSTLTLAEALGGFALATAGGIVFAVVFVLWPRLSDAVYPILVALKMVPLIALAPLVVLWFGTGYLSKVVMASIVAFFPVLVSALRGLRSVSTDHYDVFLTLSATELQVLLKLRLPSALSYTLAALRVSAVFAVVGAVVAEFIGASAGIGYYIKSASYYSEADRMIAGIFATSVVGLVLYGAVVQVERIGARYGWLGPSSGDSV